MKKSNIFLLFLFMLLLFISIPNQTQSFASDSFSQKVGQEYIYEVIIAEPGNNFTRYISLPSGITKDVQVGDQWKVLVKDLLYTNNLKIPGYQAYTSTYWDSVEAILYNKSPGTSDWSTKLYWDGYELPATPVTYGAFSATNITHPIPLSFFFFFPHNATALSYITMPYTGAIFRPGAYANWTPGPHGYDGIMYDTDIPYNWLWALKIHVTGAIEYIRYYNYSAVDDPLKLSIELQSFTDPNSNIDFPDDSFSQRVGDVYIWEATFAKPGNNLLSYLNLDESGDIEAGEQIKFEVTGTYYTNNVGDMDPTIWWHKVEGKIYNSTNTTDTWTTIMWLGYNALDTYDRAYGGAYNGSNLPPIPVASWAWAWFFPHNGSALEQIGTQWPLYMYALFPPCAGWNWSPGPADYDGILHYFESSMVPDILLWEIKIHTTGAVEYIRYYYYNGTPGVLELQVSLDLITWPEGPDIVMIVVIIVIIGGAAAAIVILWRTKLT
ncbi:MAG: hypothetical protein ACFFD2_02430 [Promethearchaeota archaeon]